MKVYFTFMQKQFLLRNSFYVIDAESEELAREKMFELVGNQFATSYTEEVWCKGGIHLYFPSGSLTTQEVLNGYKVLDR